MVSAFWLDNPSILFKKDKMWNVWPSPTDSFAGKLNAITRLVNNFNTFRIYNYPFGSIYLLQESLLSLLS